MRLGNFIGKYSQICYFTLYTILGTLCMVAYQSNYQHKMQLYVTKTYIDCEVDNDYDEETCEFIYTFQRAGVIELYAFWGIVMYIAALFHVWHWFVLVMQSNFDPKAYELGFQGFNYTRYLEACIIDSLLIGIVGVLAGYRQTFMFIGIIIMVILDNVIIYINDKVVLHSQPSTDSIKEFFYVMQVDSGKVLYPIFFSFISFCGLWISILYKLGTLNSNNGYTETPSYINAAVALTAIYHVCKRVFQLNYTLHIRNELSGNTGTKEEKQSFLSKNKNSSAYEKKLSKDLFIRIEGIYNLLNVSFRVLITSVLFAMSYDKFIIYST